MERWLFIFWNIGGTLFILLFQLVVYYGLSLASDFRSKAYRSAIILGHLATLCYCFMFYNYCVRGWFIKCQPETWSPNYGIILFIVATMLSVIELCYLTYAGSKSDDPSSS